MRVCLTLGALILTSVLATPVLAQDATLEERMRRLEEQLEQTKRQYQELEKREATREHREGVAPLEPAEPGIGPLPEVGRERRTKEQPSLSFGSTGSGRLVYAKPFVSSPKAIVGGYADIQFRSERLGTIDNGYGAIRNGQGLTNNFDQQRFVPFIYGDAKESGANVGLINYYYGSKGGLGIELYNELMSTIKAKVTENLYKLGLETTLLLQTAVEWRVLNNNMRFNKNFSRFYYDLLGENVLYKEQSVVTDFYRNLAESCDLHYSDFEIAFIAFASAGATQGINLAYDAGLIDCSSQDFINSSIHLLLNNMGLDPNLIKQIISESYEIEKMFTVRIEKNFNIV